MSVAKPWMLSSPAPSMSHSDGGFPVCRFSQTTGLGAQVSAAAGAVSPTAPPASATTTARPNRIHTTRRPRLAILLIVFPPPTKLHIRAPRTAVETVDEAVLRANRSYQ